ncbi:MAG TPA: type II toxin-antitoxin system RelE/ParE family toxin, partial [Gammaproteobacteria bacterium]|nr:type II toxin-antitoxin system RelE/ParE family toxin [Gammaproteobacteria bacterium]
MSYSLRQQAQDDLESIWVYSNQEWGAEQADKYIRSLLSRFTWLSENPQLGKQR